MWVGLGHQILHTHRHRCVSIQCTFRRSKLVDDLEMAVNSRTQDPKRIVCSLFQLKSDGPILSVLTSHLPKEDLICDHVMEMPSLAVKDRRGGGKGCACGVGSRLNRVFLVNWRIVKDGRSW